MLIGPFCLCLAGEIAADDPVTAELIDDFKGTTTRNNHNTWLSWKRGLDEEELRDHIVDYVSAHMGDVPQESRWRSKMVKTLSFLMTGQTASTQKILADQKKDLDQLKESMNKLLSKHGIDGDDEDLAD